MNKKFFISLAILLLLIAMTLALYFFLGYKLNPSICDTKNGCINHKFKRFIENKCRASDKGCIFSFAELVDAKYMVFYPQETLIPPLADTFPEAEYDCYIKNQNFRMYNFCSYLIFIGKHSVNYAVGDCDDFFSKGYESQLFFRKNNQNSLLEEKLIFKTNALFKYSGKAIIFNDEGYEVKDKLCSSMDF